MPISVVCNSCHSKLNAPDAAAGKSVKCPKCKVSLTVPLFELVDEPGLPKSDLPVAKKKVVVVEDADDAKQPPKQNGSGNMVRNIAGLLVLVTALGIAGFVWWEHNRQNKRIEAENLQAAGTDRSIAQGTEFASTTGWKEYTVAPRTTVATVRFQSFAQPSTTEFGLGSFGIVCRSATNSTRRLSISGFSQFDQTEPLKEFETTFLRSLGVGDSQESKLSGYPATESRYVKAGRFTVLRSSIIGNRLYVLFIEDEGDFPPAGLQSHFFDSFRVVDNTIPENAPDEFWKTFSSQSYRVRFPGQFEEAKVVTSWFATHGVKGAAQNLQGHSEAFVVVHFSPLPEWSAAQRTFYLKAVLTSILKAPVVESRKVMFAGKEWEEQVLEDEEVHDYATRRILDTGSEIIILHTTHIKGRISNRDRFLESFQFLK